jgi:FkbM family methyltransferase
MGKSASFRKIYIFIPKVVFYSLEFFLNKIGFTMQALARYYPEYTVELPKGALKMHLSGWSGGYTIDPLTHDFILRFGLLSDFLIDVGANRGNFTDHYFRTTQSSSAILIEPIPTLANFLRNKFKNQQNVLVVEKAVADVEKYSQFHIANNDGQSSSLSEIGNRHLLASPDTFVVNNIEVHTQTLDGITSSLKAERIFLKIDVQGHELSVLQGSRETLKKVIAIHIEVSNQHLYENDTLGYKVWSFLSENGFTLYGIDPWFRDSKHNGELIQADFFFIRNSYLWSQDK